MELKAQWLLVIPLVVGLSDVARFSYDWLDVFELDTRNLPMVDRLRTDSLQWVATPFGEHAFVFLAREAGLKLTPGITPWVWKNRDLPQPVVEATRDSREAPAELVSTEYGINIYRHPVKPYAYVTTASNEVIPCRASGIGGQIDVDCALAERGQLVVQENVYSGWSASLNSQGLPLQTSPWLAVNLPAGTYHVQFRYRPWDVPVGLALTLLGVALAIRLWFRRPATTGGQSAISLE